MTIINQRSSNCQEVSHLIATRQTVLRSNNELDNDCILRVIPSIYQIVATYIRQMGKNSTNNYNSSRRNQEQRKGGHAAEVGGGDYGSP